MSLQEQRRARFEVHAKARGLATGRATQAMMFANGRRVPVGGYILYETAEAWEAYNAALDSVEIELPKIDISLSTGHSDAWCEGVLHAGRVYRDTIEAAGVRVKP